MVSTARISGEENLKKTEPDGRASWLSVSTEDDGEQSPDASLVHYFRYGKDESSPPR